LPNFWFCLPLVFANCFRHSTGRRLLAVDVRGLLRDVQRKNVEAMALAQGVAVRTLQRFLESIAWGEELLCDLLYVAFGCWQVEACFREVKEEFGWDHFECRGWQCIHRHLYVTILNALFCARVRQQLSPSQLVTSGELLTLEQVRRAANVFLDALDLPPKQRQQRYQQELDCQAYYQHRNATAARSHRKTRPQQLQNLGLDPDQIKSVYPKPPLT
jgi:hypothetical protein